MSKDFYYLYVFGVVVTFIVGLISVRKRGFKMTVIMFLLCVFTALLSWIGLGVLYQTFNDRD